MRRKLLPFHAATFLIFLLGAVSLGETPQADTETPPGVIRFAPSAVPPALADLLEKGQALESERRWSEALLYYEQALRSHPGERSLVERMNLAKIHFNLGRRYSDRSFRQALTSLSWRSALDLYSEVLLKIDSHYVASPPWQELVGRGTASLRVALSNEAFRQHNRLTDTPAEEVARFQRLLEQLTQSRVVQSRQDARRLMEDVARLASAQLRMAPTTVAFEYICGAVGGLDDYSAYLTGDQLKEVYAQIEGNFVGLGVELKADDGALLIVRVIPHSPAERAGIVARDRIVVVNGQPTEKFSTDEAASMLQGPEGSFVEIVIVNENQVERRLRIRRAQVDVPSIEDEQMVDADSGVAYLKLTSFQRNTVADLDATLLRLHRQGMRSLIIDVRGNPGGLLTAAVEVADRFLPQGVIVSTRGRGPGEDFRYAAHQGGTWRMPLIVLIDGDSASASEIFAAAILDYHRGTVLGTRSYGKGSVQGIFPLSTAGAGIRLTTAKFFAPTGWAISKRGVEPDIQVGTALRVSQPRQQPLSGRDTVLEYGVMMARRNRS